MNTLIENATELPILNHLIKKARNLIKAQKSLSNLDDDLKNLLKSDELLRLINRMATDFSLDPSINPVFLQQGQILLCSDFYGPVIAIGYTKAETENGPLYSSTSEALLGAISTDGFQYQLRDIGSDWNPDIFSTDVTITEAKTYHCSAGETLLVPTSKIFDYLSSGDVIIKIAAPAKVGLTWEFNRITRMAEQVYASTLEATTLSYIIKFLSLYGNEKSIEAINHMIKHRFHFIRWDAVKAIGKIDSENLPYLLRILEKDAHPHVSAASKKMLSQLGVS